MTGSLCLMQGISFRQLSNFSFLILMNLIELAGVGQATVDKLNNVGIMTCDELKVEIDSADIVEIFGGNKSLIKTIKGQLVDKKESDTGTKPLKCKCNITFGRILVKKGDPVTHEQYKILEKNKRLSLLE